MLCGHMYQVEIVNKLTAANEIDYDTTTYLNPHSLYDFKTNLLLFKEIMCFAFI
jgi:hypothetical protein